MGLCMIQVEWVEGRDVWWHDEMAKVSDECEPEWMGAEEPLFMLYTRSVRVVGC